MEEIDEIINNINNNIKENSYTYLSMLSLIEIFDLLKKYKNKKYKFKLYRRAERKIIGKILELLKIFIQKHTDLHFDSDIDDETALNQFNMYIYKFLALFFEEMYKKRCSHFFCRSSFKKIYKENKSNPDIIRIILSSDEISNHSVLSKKVRQKLAIAAGIHIDQDDRRSSSSI